MSYQEIPPEPWSFNDAIPSPSQGLVPLCMEHITSVHALGRDDARGILPAFPMERSQVLNTTRYPDTGSIATFTSDRSLQFKEIVNSVAKKYPLQEVGTGKLKFHQKPDGSNVTYCGTIRPDENGNVAACKRKPYEHRIKGIPNACKRRAWPECWPEWAKKGGQRFSSVLNGYIREIIPNPLKERLCKALEHSASEPGNEDPLQVQEIRKILDDGDRWLPRHVVFSPDFKTIARLILHSENALEKKGIDIKENPWRYRNEFYKVFMKKYRRAADQVIRLAGLTAYAEITHDIRLKKNKESDKADRRQDMNRYREILDQRDWRYNTRFSPHSHAAGWGLLMNSEEFHKRTGWIYVNYGTVFNAAGLAKYLLSHAPDNPGLHSIRYGGDLNPSKMSLEGEIKIPEFPPCEDCLEEGTPRNKAELVIAKLASVEYVKVKDNKTQIASWEFTEEGISSKPYRITKIIQVYRRRSPAVDPRSPVRIQDPIPPWLSEEERQDRERLLRLQRKERERIQMAQVWLPLSAWIKLGKEDQARYKWRQYYSEEEYAAAPAVEKVLTFEWI